MSRRKLVAPLAISVVGLLAVALVYATRPRLDPRPPERLAPLVRAQRVEGRPLRFFVRTQGTVVPRSESGLVAQVSGEVVWVSPSLASGGFFQAGDPLVRIDPTDYELELEMARATVTRAESEHARARAEFERQTRLAEREAASETRIDDARSAFRVAEATLREARARQRRATRDLERTELRAPFVGRVRTENVDRGQFVSRGDAIATLYAVDHAEVRLPVPDRELRFLDAPLHPRDVDGDGPEVVLRAEFAGRKHEWRGRVVRTEGELDPKSRMVHLVARVEDPYGLRDGAGPAPLAVGLFVDAEILGRQVDRAVVLPRAALREGPQGDAVLVVEEDGRLRFRSVDVLRASGDDLVIGAGLADGELVCVSSLPAPVDGMAVRVVEDSAEPAVASGVRP